METRNVLKLPISNLTSIGSGAWTVGASFTPFVCPQMKRRVDSLMMEAGQKRGLLIAISVIALALVLFAVGDGLAPKPRALSTPSSLPLVDKSPQLQAQRKQAIDGLIQRGVFQKIEVPGSLPRVWVRPSFYTLDFDQKQTAMNVVYAYYFDGSDEADVVRIFDSMSGKDTGSYSLRGLELY